MGLGSVPGGPGASSSVSGGGGKGLALPPALSCPVLPPLPRRPEPCCLGKAAPGVWQAPRPDPWPPSPAGHEPELLPSRKVSCTPLVCPTGRMRALSPRRGRLGSQRASWGRDERVFMGVIVLLNSWQHRTKRVQAPLTWAWLHSGASADWPAAPARRVHGFGPSESKALSNRDVCRPRTQGSARKTSEKMVSTVRVRVNGVGCEGGGSLQMQGDPAPVLSGEKPARALLSLRSSAVPGQCPLAVGQATGP